MKLNVRAIAIAQGIVGGILFVLCRLVFMLFPDATLASSKYLFHTDWSSVASPVTLGGFFLGLVLFMVFWALVGAAWASIYNWMSPESISSVRATSSSTRVAA
jgi:2TM family of unknown function (DUF5676)